MTIIGITGHRNLPATTARLVRQALRDALADYGPGVTITGVTALADGADQLFAHAVLDRGGRIEAIVPAASYRSSLPAECRAEYDDLLGRAVRVHRLGFAKPTSEAYMAAGKLMISLVDELFAVWDHQPARGFGGTADVVKHAREHGYPVRVIWPAGVVRD